MEETFRFSDFDVATDFRITEIPKQRCIINTINAYSWVMTDSNPDFKKALQTSDVLLPDGVSIVFAARLLASRRIRKVAGADLHQMLLDALDAEGGRCFYLGASSDTLQKIEERLRREYPAIKAGSYSPPYKAEFSAEDNEKMWQAINTFSPDVVFVGMTAPKQELWIYRNIDELQTRVICGIGAVFDFYAGTQKRPPQWMISCGLEWLGRLIGSPKRLWKRYLVYNLVFLYKLSGLYFNRLFSKK